MGRRDTRGQDKSQRAFFRRRDVRAIVAQLERDDTACALGLTVLSPSPVLALCRKLVDAGHDPATPLEAYRGGALALRVKSIGQAAGLAIGGDGVGFRPAANPDTAPPMRYFREAAE